MRHPRPLPLLLLALVPWTGLRAQQYIEKELAFRYVQYAPSGDLFDSGWGIEGSVRTWRWDRFGYAFGLGLDDYTFKDNPSFLNELSGASRIDGTVGLIPLQASLLYAPYRGESVSVVLEAGLRYMVSVTSADVVVRIGEGELSQPIDMADSIAAIAGVEVAYHGFDAGALVLGVGMMQNVVKGEYGVNAAAFGDADISAPFVHLSFSFSL